MKSIIAGTDFSPRAASAVRYAAALAKDSGASLTLYHAVVLAGPHSSALESHGDAVDHFLISQAKADAQHHIESLRLTCGPDFNPAIVIDTADDQASGIAAAAQRKGADAIVVGLRGAGPVSRKILGSVASRLLDCPSGVPVIAVPRHARYRGLHTAVLNSDLSQFPAEAAALASFLAPLHPALHVLHLTESPAPDASSLSESSLAAAAATTDWANPVFAQFSADDWVEAIDDYVADHLADIVCFIPRPHSLWEDLFGNRLITNLAFESTVPLLSLPVTSN
jgi:nucleotide-binding universal stress UspA family protein